jgi:DNA modification methylase
LEDSVKPYYEENGIVIYNADCREVLPSLPKVDLVLTDPPYDEFTHRGAFTVAARHIQADGHKAGVPFAALAEAETTVRELLKTVEGWLLIFCSLEMLGRYQSAAVDNYVRGGIWDRITNTPQISGDRPAQGGEGVAIFHSRHGGRMEWKGGGKAAIWRYQVEAGLKYHPTQKPLKLIRELVSLFSADESDTILDPFMGSGTTLRAAKDLGRKAIGIEIEEKYCEIAANRLRQEVLVFA